MDYGEEVPKSLTKLTKILKERFGGEGQNGIKDTPKAEGEKKKQSKTFMWTYEG